VLFTKEIAINVATNQNMALHKDFAEIDAYYQDKWRQYYLTSKNPEPHHQCVLFNKRLLLYY